MGVVRVLLYTPKYTSSSRSRSITHVEEDAIIPQRSFIEDTHLFQVMKFGALLLSEIEASTYQISSWE